MLVPFKNMFNNFWSFCSVTTRQSEKIAFENTKETISNLIKSTIVEFFGLKNKAIDLASQEIRKITETLSSTLANIDANIYKCEKSLIKIKNTTLKNNLNYLLKPENQATYIFINSVLMDPYFALPEDSKRNLLSQFDDYYFKYEKTTTETILANIESINAAQKTLKGLCEDNPLPAHENCTKEEIDSLFYQAKKDFDDLDKKIEVKFLYEYSASNFKSIFNAYSKKFKDFSDEYKDYKSNINVFNDKNIYFFTSLHELKVHDIDAKSSSILKINGIKKHSINTSLIPISNTKLFICESLVAIPCIINIENMTIQKLPSGLSYQETGGVYFKNKVYIFGGIEMHQPINAAHKYDLEKNTWERLAFLRRPVYDCSCVSFKNKILISGFGRTWLYLYDILLDSYSEIFKVGTYNKVTAVGNNRAYLFEFPGNIYESGVEDEYLWKRIGANRIWGKNCYRVFYKKSFYFGMGSQLNLFCKFNLEKKKLKMVTGTKI